MCGSLNSSRLRRNAPGSRFVRGESTRGAYGAIVRGSAVRRTEFWSRPAIRHSGTSAPQRQPADLSAGVEPLQRPGHAAAVVDDVHGYAEHVANALGNAEGCARGGSSRHDDRERRRRVVGRQRHTAENLAVHRVDVKPRRSRAALRLDVKPLVRALRHQITELDLALHRPSPTGQVALERRHDPGLVSSHKHHANGRPGSPWAAVPLLARASLLVEQGDSRGGLLLPAALVRRLGVLVGLSGAALSGSAQSAERAQSNRERPAECFTSDRRAVAPARFASLALWGGLAGLYEPGLVGEDGGLRAIAEIQFGEDPVDVGFDRRFADDQRGGDFRV